MAWERRGNKLYFYRSLRRGNRIIKQYLGHGERGHLAAEADQAARDARRRTARLRKERNLPVEELAAQIDEFGQLVDQLVSCELLCAGWKMHKRQWRSPKNGRGRNNNRRN